MRPGIFKSERGASAIMVAISAVLVMGVAAIAIDATGFGFNERRQAQAAADTSVMAGGLGFLLAETETTKVTNALDVARANLNATYSDAEWQSLWENCVDPDRTAVDVGTGTPVSFTPMASPWGGTLDCVSQSSSFMRVRIPDQIFATSFGGVIGVDSLETHAAAVARIEPISEFDGLLPFGIPGGSGPGELCLSTNPSGPAQPPCQGPNGGGFGAINAELFGDFFGTPSCSNPGAPELEQNIALGMDHFIDKWSAADAGAEGVTSGSPHPGDGTIGGYQNVSFDQCRLVGGSVVPEDPTHQFPPNTLRVDTGFSQSNAVEDALISNKTYLGQKSRLQDTTNPTRNLIKKSTGGTSTVYVVDNRGPWDYLTGSGDCDSASYSGLTTDQKVALFHTCLSNYSGTADIFDSNIRHSPRFGWAPEYWHAASTSGTSWQPVKEYNMVFLAGLWFNCDASTCEGVFYPDTDVTSDLCLVFGGGCKELSLGQMSAWLLPSEAVPNSVSSSFPGGEVSPFSVALFR